MRSVVVTCAAGDLAVDVAEEEAGGAQAIGDVGAAGGAGGDLAALVTVQLDGTNYKRKIENGIDEYPNRRILFVCIRKYADRILWLIQ
ncbi:flavonoid 3',5'-hydroxylase [Trifolium repens]|nr:flavonoid 3',5'-hydroxylase [Trifolium repens]